MLLLLVVVVFVDDRVVFHLRVVVNRVLLYLTARRVPCEVT